MNEMVLNLGMYLKAAGLLFLGVGLLFLFCPKELGKINQWTSRRLFTDAPLLRRPKMWGGFFLLVAVLMGVASIAL